MPSVYSKSLGATEGAVLNRAKRRVNKVYQKKFSDAVEYPLIDPTGGTVTEKAERLIQMFRNLDALITHFLSTNKTHQLGGFTFLTNTAYTVGAETTGKILSTLQQINDLTKGVMKNIQFVPINVWNSLKTAFNDYETRGRGTLLRRIRNLRPTIGATAINLEGFVRQAEEIVKLNKELRDMFKYMDETYQPARQRTRLRQIEEGQDLTGSTRQMSGNRISGAGAYNEMLMKDALMKPISKGFDPRPVYSVGTLNYHYL